jgi:hypothetical protein
MFEHISGLMADLISSDSRLRLDYGPVTENEIQVLKQRNVFAASDKPLDEIEQRREAARGLIRKAFSAAVFHLGAKEALEVWSETAKKRRAGKKGPRQPNRDAFLLWMYDELLRQEPGLEGRAPRIIATYLDRGYQGKYGASAVAIAKQVRRLIAKRRTEANLISFGLAGLGLGSRDASGQ